jgi:hypothetical protein
VRFRRPTKGFKALEAAISKTPAAHSEERRAAAKALRHEPPPAPEYASWEEYPAATTERERRAWCASTAKKANRQRLLSDAPDVMLVPGDVLDVLIRARGRCAFCGSRAVE